MTPESRPNGAQPLPGSFAEAYPYTDLWVRKHGWIELGRDPYGGAFVKALDLGGVVWEGEGFYSTVEDALRALEAGLQQWVDAGDEPAGPPGI